jgi:hypothetical protein
MDERIGYDKFIKYYILIFQMYSSLLSEVIFYGNRVKT